MLDSDGKLLLRLLCDKLKKVLGGGGGGCVDYSYDVQTNVSVRNGIK